MCTQTQTEQLCQSIETQCGAVRESAWFEGEAEEWMYCIKTKGHAGPCLDADGVHFNYGV